MITTFRLLRLAVLVGFLVTMTFIDGRSQRRLGIQFRPGISFATTKLVDANLKTGFGFEIAGTYRFMPHTSIYAGWGWNRFSSDHSFAGDDMDFEETGYALGLQFIHPFVKHLPFDYYLRAGALYNHIEVENTDGKIISDSGHGFGFQVETGFSFSLLESLRIIPGIKYQTLSRELSITEVEYMVDLNYLSVGVTVSKLF